MKLTLFLANLGLCITVVSIAMFHLRRTTRRDIGELCQSDGGAEFWLRSADILVVARNVWRTVAPQTRRPA
jgi:hypothetical protein